MSTHSYQEKPSETNLRITRWGTTRNRHSEILGEKSSILHGIERSVEHNVTQVRGRTA